MSKSIPIFFLIFGLFLTLLNLVNLIRGYEVYMNGVEITGVIVEKKVKPQGSTALVLYTIECKYMDSLYINTYSLGDSFYSKSDSITYFFKLGEMNGLIFPIDSQFRFGNYLGLLIGLIFIILPTYYFIKY